MVRLILYAILGFLIYTIVKAVVQGVRAPAPPPRDGVRNGETMERDPVCGKFITRDDAVAATSGGRTHWFCSSGCRDEYLRKH